MKLSAEEMGLQVVDVPRESFTNLGDDLDEILARCETCPECQRPGALSAEFEQYDRDGRIRPERVERILCAWCGWVDV